MQEESLEQAFLREKKRRAFFYLHQAYHFQISMQLENAIYYYKKSIGFYPTPEAHTFLGWTHSLKGEYDQAIEACKKAILIDPEYGNLYNDIGSYLIEKGEYDQALLYLQKAIQSKPYDTNHFAYFNLGRAWTLKGDLKKAAQAFERALAKKPNYTPAYQALLKIQKDLS